MKWEALSLGHANVILSIGNSSGCWLKNGCTSFISSSHVLKAGMVEMPAVGMLPLSQCIHLVLLSSQNYKA